jgi:hypothetical protein
MLAALDCSVIINVLYLGPSEKCGCMYVSPEDGDLVIDLDVTFDVDRSFHLEGKITVSHF